MTNYAKTAAFMCAAGLLSCSGPAENTESTHAGPVQDTVVVIHDSHSYSNTGEVHSTHLHLNLDVDFEKSVVSGNVVHDIANTSGTTEMIFDMNDEKISKVTLDDDTATTTFTIGPDDELLGSPLSVTIKPQTKKVTIYFETSSQSSAIQWLTPQQTAGKKHPYLFTQGEAVLTRTWIPCQDTPGNRITYSADVQVPANLMAVMSATNPTEKSADGNYHFEMDKAIPTYLIALAVGDLEFASLGERTGVYSEPSMISKCVYEFADVEKMVETAEGLYGEYQWGRYDIIVLPPSFPFGGMENPKLTFATPTILAGDRSLVSLIAHELAHSWSGNLVTNATWDDFWLNEGFTVYIENRIMEAIYGKDYSDMLLSIEYQELQAENEDILSGNHPEDTHLKLHLEGRDPDEGMTSIAYVKGALFLKTLEASVGREKFDPFLKGYFETYAFQPMTTEMFVDYLNKNLLTPNHVNFNVDEWIYGEGIPESCIAVESDRFEKVSEKAALITSISSAKELNVKKTDWSTQEWMHFIRQIPEEANASKMAMLDKEYNFSNCGNSEIMAEWYVVSIRKDYDKIDPYMEDFLINVGRRKFLQPIYEELAKSEEGLAQAKAIYAKARPNYHAISSGTVDEILGWEKDRHLDY
jgi:leukotriene-A4 hydrolase